MTKETRATWCGLCHSRCGLLLDFEDGQATKVRGDPDHPASRGRICSRGRLILDHLYHPERLDYPLKRSGPRGSGTFQRVSWEQALDEVAARLDSLRNRHGAETLAMSRGTFRSYHWEARRFLNGFGTPNLTGANPICHCPSVVVESAMMGSMTHGDLARCECLVIWGSGRSVSSPVTQWKAIRDAKERGAKIVTVDPRRIQEAEIADIWLPIRPGTDLALLWGWLHVVIGEGLHDREFVENHTLGFAELSQKAEAYPPERVAALTGLPSEDIIRSARLYATTSPAVIAWGHGLDKQGPNTDGCLQTRAALKVICGNVDRAGGECFGLGELPGKVVSGTALERNEALSEAQRAKQLGAETYPLFSYTAWERVRASLARLPVGALEPETTGKAVVAHPSAVYGAMTTGKPYPVRALIVQAANPVITLADPQRTLAALRALDLLVVMDYYQTPTSALADYVFPAACTVERDDLSVFGAPIIAHPRGLDPLGERRDDFQLWRGLGLRLGQAEQWPWESMEQVLEARLAPAGLSWEELKQRKVVIDPPRPGRFRAEGFGTSTGKIELAASIIAELSGEALPDYQPGLDPNEAYPLLMITGSCFNPMYHSEHRRLVRALAEVPDPLVSLHPGTGASLGIADGDWVRVETPLGTIRQRAQLSNRIPEGVADSQHGWWFPDQPLDSDKPGEAPYGCLESNVNIHVLDTPEHCAPGTGAWRQTAIPCRIVREECKKN